MSRREHRHTISNHDVEFGGDLHDDIMGINTEAAGLRPAVIFPALTWI